MRGDEELLARDLDARQSDAVRESYVREVLEPQAVVVNAAPRRYASRGCACLRAARLAYEAHHPDPLLQRGRAASRRRSADLPRELAGIDKVEWLIIDDGSTDRTVEVARENGVDHIVKLTNNKGLAAGFQAGLDACLKLGADVIVNTDADNQYTRGRHPQAGRADPRRRRRHGRRRPPGREHRALLDAQGAAPAPGQRRRPARVRHARSPTPPAASAPTTARPRSSFRSSRSFTYTLESIIQAGKMLVATDHTPIGTNPKTRESRLFPSMWAYVRRNGVAIFRIYSLYEPLRVFMTMAAILGAGRRGHLGPLRLLLHRRGRGRRPRPVADPRRRAVHRRRAARGARRDGRHPRPACARCSSARSNAYGASSCSSASSRRTTSPGQPTTEREPHHGRRRRARHREDRRARGAEAVSTSDDRGVPTGNTYDKYGSQNPVVRRLMAGFERSLDELWDMASPDVDPRRRLRRGRPHLRVGRAAGRGPDRRHRPARPEARGRVGEAPARRTSSTGPRRPRSLSFADGEFDMATAIEVLEHVPDPEATRRRDGARVAKRWLLVSVPREPIWRMTNMARGAYWKSLGNTPGHVNHWSQGGVRLAALAPREGGGSPHPVPVDDGSCPSRRLSASRLLRERRADPRDRDRGHRSRHLRVLRRSPRMR